MTCSVYHPVNQSSPSPLPVCLSVFLSPSLPHSLTCIDKVVPKEKKPGRRTNKQKKQILLAAFPLCRQTSINARPFVYSLTDYLLLTVLLLLLLLLPSSIYIYISPHNSTQLNPIKDKFLSNQTFKRKRPSWLYISPMRCVALR